MLKIAKVLVAGTAISLAAMVSAFAADLYEPPVIEYIPPEPVYGGWYLRGHIGMSNQQVKSLSNVLFTAPGVNDFQIRDKNFEAGPTFALGAGYKVNNYLRVDGIVEYRGEVGFHGLDTWVDGGGNARYNNYTAKKSEWLLMANAYADLGDFHGVVPYVGAGIGASRNTIHSFRDMGIDPTTNAPTMGYAGAASKWNLAWALHAGVGIKATDRMTIDLGYSYLNLGHAQSGDIVTYTGVNAVDNPMHFRNITSHDFKLGVRYALN